MFFTVHKLNFSAYKIKMPLYALILTFKNLVQMSVLEAHMKSVWYLVFQIGIQSVLVWF